MAAHWYSLVLLGVALLQGTFSLSPIPVPDEEWEEFSRMMRDPSYRLPTTTVPRHYEVSLTPYFDSPPLNITPFSFTGEVTIFIRPTIENVNEILMHCNDLTINTLTVEYTNEQNQVQQIAANQDYACEMPRSFLRIPTTETLRTNQEYQVKATFNGNLQTNMRGFYRSWYRDGTARRWMATTQFQPGHARQAFPCYDEPGFKATFDITMNREPDFSPTISNMPIKSTGTTPDGSRVSETFYTTPYTSTYLLAFIVSHYQVIASDNNPERPFAIYGRDNANTTGEWSLEIGKLLLAEMERYTDFPYYTMASNMNMKQAAIPDFSAGAMENWGLLTYREALILYDPLNSNHFYRQRVANIVAHEIAHMWFGNLVTCAWWDNLWLNEGFARFYQYYLTATVAEDMGYPTRFIVEQFLVAMASDSVDSAHALTNPAVNNPTTVSAHFSTITYARGASILRMTQHLLGESTYEKALRSYLKDRQFRVAEPHHLFQALDDAAAADGALSGYPGITIDRYFRTWSEKAGHPILSVSVDQRTGLMTVTQARWERNTGVSAYPGLWDVPITWTRQGAADFQNLKPTQFLTAQSTNIDRGTTGLEWVVFNKQASGFYRVNYDPTNWALLTQALRANPNVIHEYNRAQIIDDLFNLGRANVLTYDRVFNIISFLEFDDDYAPWIAAIDGFSFIRRRIAHDAEQLEKLHEVIKQLSTAVTRRLGYSEIPGEPYMDGLLRMYLLNFLCDIGHQDCVQAGRQNFQNWKNGQFIPANMRPWVYCVGLRDGNADDFDFFWNRYLAEDLASEEVVMITAAGCTSDTESLERFLNATLSEDDIVRPQDFSTAFNSAVGRNEYNTLKVLDWVKRNFEPANVRLGSVTTLLSNIGPRLLTENDIQEYASWLNANQEALGPAYTTGINGVNTARNNLAWSDRRMAELAKFFETNYVVDVIEEIDDAVPTDAPQSSVTPNLSTTTTEAPTPEPGSANIASISAFMLLISLVINLVN